MPRLVLKKNSEVIKEYFWKTKEKIVVGSSKKADIYINDTANVHDIHCTFSKLKDKYFVSDNQTLTGTLVNGKTITSSEIKYNDEISFGQSEYSIMFLSDKPSETELYLVGIYGKFYSKKYLLKNVTHIGRTTKNPQGEKNDIILSTDETVSKGHCKILLEDKKVYIVDIGSTCGTTINGQKLPYFEKVQLEVGDEVCIGRSIFRLCSATKLKISSPKKQKILFLKILQIATPIIFVLVICSFLYVFFSGLTKYFLFAKKTNDLQLQATTKYFYGNEEFVSNTSTEVFISPSISLGHFNKDDIADIVYLDKKKVLYVWDGKTGAPIFPPKEFGITDLSGVVVEDINDDKIDDIIFVTQDAKLVAIDGYSGTEILKLQLQGNPGNLVPCVFDINLDGKKDIVACNEEGVVYLVYSAGFSSLVDIKTVATKSPLYASPVIAYSDKLPPLVVVCSYNGDITLIDGKTGNFRSLSLVGLTKKPHFVSVAPACGDLNGDGIPELVFVTTLPQYVTCVDIVASRALWSYFIQLQPQQEFKYFSSPIIVDFNRDGQNDVLFLSPIGYLFCFAGSTDFSGGELLWSIQLNPQKLQNVTVAQPAVANLAENLSVEVICGDEEGYIYVVGNVNNKGKILQQGRFFREEKIISPIVLGDINGDGFISILFLTDSNLIRVINTNSKSLKGMILNKGYLYTAGHFYQQVEDIESQRDKMVISFGGILFLGLFLQIRHILKKRKFFKRKKL